VPQHRTGRLALGAVSLYVLGVTIGMPLLALGSGAVDDPDATICPPGASSVTDDRSPTILGLSTLDARDLTAWWDTTGRGQPPRLEIPIDDLIALYISEGEAEGARGDLAFTQAVHETGYFTNRDTGGNNYAGIAHHDDADAGQAYPDPPTGVRAHIQLLKKYAAANTTPLAHPDVAPDADARATTWSQLTGTWATAPDYWQRISALYQSMLESGDHDRHRPTTTPQLTRCEPTSAPSPSDLSLTLTSVRDITVHSSIAAELDALLSAADTDRVHLSGTGYRSHQRQIELRRAHCGTSHHAIYQAPASSCTPPTARPGTSMHERGLAIDFNNCTSHTTRCWQWLNNHAAEYGLSNLPSEPWHWSTNGQ
jgi:LAS superfamily LD-carboxypeptidase LdcB